jgi:two-component system, OmpR family, clock-associated histidine kinase SasA
MQVPPDPILRAEVPLQFLLFVDRRPTSREQIRQIRALLEELGATAAYELQVVDVTEQPYLAEHFRLITTPTLIKLFPEPQQMLAGSSLISQLRNWWTRWEQQSQDSILVESSRPPAPPKTAIDGLRPDLGQAAEILQLSDEIFQLKQQKEALESQLQFKDHIIAMLAHDLRNPLTAASIALETLDMGFHPKEQETAHPRFTRTLITQLLRQGRSQLRTIDSMITDILQAAHGTNVELRIHPQPIDLGELCLNVLQDFDDRLSRKGITLTTDIPSDLPQVYIDPERIRQVLINLLDNAIKYTSDGGKIDLSALHRTTQKVQVSLCDNGLGIPEDNRKHIFATHFRLKRDETTQEGYGIGLSLCQSIVRAHYGQIWVDSVPGQGSAFHFTLPVHRG